MRPENNQFRKNLVYGAIALLPVALIAYVVFKVAGPVKKATAVVGPHLGIHPYAMTAIIVVMSVVALVFTCVAIGALMRSRAGSEIFSAVQSGFGNVIPGYEIVTNLLRGAAGERMAYPPALIRLFEPGTAVLGFVMEDVDGDANVTVFVPSTPVMTVGAVHIVERSRVQRIEAGAKDVADCISNWGLGTCDLLQGEAKSQA